MVTMTDGWFEAPERAHEKAKERINAVNDALAAGKAVTLDYKHKHDRQDTVIYHDEGRDLLIYSPYVEGRRRVFGYTQADHPAVRAMVINIAFADDLRITEVEDTQLYHAAYGLKPVENSWGANND